MSTSKDLKTSSKLSAPDDLGLSAPNDLGASKDLSTSSNTKYLEKNLTIGNAIQTIAHFEDDSSLDFSKNAILMRSYTHQVVIGSQNFYYKIYESNARESNALDHLVRCCLQTIYQNLGLYWKLISFERDGKLFDFEQRKKLRVATFEEDGSFENILLSFSKIYDQVEEMLEFESVLKQLNSYPEFSQVAKIKLSRQNINKHNDYGVFKGQAILLDDAEFCMEFLDNNNEVLEISFDKELTNKESTDKEPTLVISGNSYSLHKMPDNIFHGWGLKPKNRQCAAIKKANTQFSSELLTNTDAELANSVEISGRINKESSDVDAVSNASGALDMLGAPGATLGTPDMTLGAPNTMGTTKIANPAEIAKTAKIKLNAQLTNSVETDLYTKLDEAFKQNSNVCLATKLNPAGKLLNESEFFIWKSHMKTISTYYPNVHKVTSIEITQEFCTNYIQQKFDAEDFFGRYKTAIEYILPSKPDSFPTRRTFREFLLKYAKRNANTFDLIFEQERKIMHTHEQQEYSGKHYKYYSDSDECILCDYEQIKKAMAQ